MSSVETKRQDIQYLRALAVCAVVIFHARQTFLPNGYLGVDIFFFISGYVLTPQLASIFFADNNEILNKTTQFFSKRFKRLIPAFTYSIMISMLLILCLSSTTSVLKSAKQALKSIFFLGNINAESLLGNYFNPIPNPFLHLWSLSAEWQIYIFVPSLFIFIFAIRIRRDKQLLTLLLSLVAIFSVISGILGNQTSAIFGYYSPLVRIWQFALGSLAFIYFGHKQLSQRWKILARVILAISIVFLLCPIQLNHFHAWSVATFIFFSLILGRLGEYGLFSKVLSWLGDRSYSIYLYHLPFIYLAIYSPMSASNQRFRIVGVLLAVTLTIIVAHISFLYVEGFLKPIRQKWAQIFSLYLIGFVIVLATLIASSLSHGLFHNARSSVAWSHMTKCLGGIQFACSVIDNPHSSASILVVGDSHAQQYFSELRRFGVREKIDIEYSTNFDVQSIREINPKMIIISKFHSTFDNESLEIFRNQLEELRTSDIPMIYVSDNPVFKDYMHYTHYMNPSFASILFERLKIIDAPKKIVNISDIDLTAFVAGKKFSQTAQEFGIVVNPFDVLCSSISCYRYNASEWVYWDDHHLSEFGAELVFRSISPQILKILDFNSGQK
jgi:peptidoglycan/LPS O-acetylase OafA/YrhL